MILTMARDNSGRCVGLRLPAEPADIAAAYEKLDAVSTNDRQTRILRADTGVGSLDRWLRDRKMDRPGDYIKLGELAEKIGQKQGGFRQDSATQTAVFIPSREDSLERMQEEDKAEFVLTAPSPEDEAVHSDELGRLRKALEMLKPEEYELIYALFFEGMTEREYAKRIGSAPMTIHNRKVRIQGKLKKLMEK